MSSTAPATEIERLTRQLIRAEEWERENAPGRWARTWYGAPAPALHTLGPLTREEWQYLADRFWVSGSIPDEGPPSPDAAAPLASVNSHLGGRPRGTLATVAYDPAAVAALLIGTRVNDSP